MRQTQIADALRESQARLLETQTKLSTTREVSASSDDPVRYDRSSRLKTLLARNEQYQENIDDGLGWAVTSADTLDILNNILLEIHTNGIRARGNLNPDDRTIAAEAVDSFIEEMIDLGNSQFMDKYLFGGTVTQGTKPFAYDGSTVTYQGNDETMTRKVGPDTFLEINTVGSEFAAIFSASIAMRDAMLADDGPAIQAATLAVEEATKDLLNTMNDIGNKQKKLELTKDNLITAVVNIESQISQAEDVDLTRAIMDYNTNELAYRAALESTSRILNLTILDFLA
jgi:flagellar hook-associated protein 3 FlgL